MSRPRLTAHQREVFERLQRYADRRGTWVRGDSMGSVGALERLVNKGYADRMEEQGPRGGRIFYYLPITDEVQT